MTLKKSYDPHIIYDLIKIADFHFLLEPRNRTKHLKVSFNNTVEVCEIISRDYISEHELKDTLWWNTTDYELFKANVLKDIEMCMNICPDIDFNTARKTVLYHKYEEIIYE
jgi:hypothetical protein